MKKKSLLLFLFFVVLISGCKKYIQPGIPPAHLDNDIKYKRGRVYFKKERLEVKYLYVKDYIRKDCPDIIFYLHGIYTDELEWVERNGFGTMFYNIIKENPEFKSFTVVSISLGGAYLFIQGAPYPFNADMETFFTGSIVPYFKKMLSKNGKVYLIGHSLGGFNSLMLSLRHPDMFPAIAVISPYVAPISPFTDAFDEKGRQLHMSDFQVKMLKNMLIHAFATEEKWDEYNPFKLLDKTGVYPYISLSDARNDLPGFEWSIDNFNEELVKHNVRHSFCKSGGSHDTACRKVFYDFLSEISK